MRKYNEFIKKILNKFNIFRKNQGSIYSYLIAILEVTHYQFIKKKRKSNNAFPIFNKC